MNYELGTVIGDYQIVGVLGAGGMGQVYKVRNMISDRIEAMKILLPNLDADQELAERFLREIRVQASLDHPNIAALRTAQRVGNQLVMIMEYIEGSTIESIMRDTRIPVRECADYVSQVLSALAYAHARGIVHRDIKPANIMLTPGGIVKLMDFGIAKVSIDHRLTQAGKTVGSLFYMSPEQIRGDANLDPRSDLYSLGITLYEMVTGQRPFEGESDYSIMAAHLQQPPQPPVHVDPSLPPTLNDIILISIAKDPSQRFQSAEAFRGALKSIESELGVGPALGAGGTQLYSRPAPATGPRTAPLTPPRGQTPARSQTIVEPSGMTPPSQPHLQPMPAPPPQRVPSQPGMQSFTPPPPHPAPPQFQAGPQPYANMPPQQAQSGGHRGLYMVLGSLVTIGILVGAALYVPKLLNTHAGGEPTKTTAEKTVVQKPPEQKPIEQKPVQQKPAEPPQQATTTRPGTPEGPKQVAQITPPSQQRPQQVIAPQHVTAPVRPQPIAQTQPPVRVEQQPPARVPQEPPVQYQQPPQHPTQAGMPQPGGPAAPTGNSGGAELQELEHQHDLMIPRIEAVNTGLAKLQQEQSRMGVGLSPELIARQRRMQFYMETASGALRRGNVGEARTSLNNAERELDKLEERFGR